MRNGFLLLFLCALRISILAALSFPLPVYVVTIARHSHRVASLQHILGPVADVFSFPPTLTTDWVAQEPYAAADSKSFTPDVLKSFQLYPHWVDPTSGNPWWRKPMTKGEIAASLGHWHVWQHHKRRIDADRLRRENSRAGVKESGSDRPSQDGSPAASGASPLLATEYCLVLEDDVEFSPAFSSAMLRQAVQDLTAFDPDWGLLYLGRCPIKNVDEKLRFVVPHIVRPSFSYCSHAYILSPKALVAILASKYDRNMVVVDEFLPALYTHHLRADMRALFSKISNDNGATGKGNASYLMAAYAFHPSVVLQTSSLKTSGTVASSDIVWALGNIINDEFLSEASQSRLKEKLANQKFVRLNEFFEPAVSEMIHSEMKKKIIPWSRKYQSEQPSISVDGTSVKRLSEYLHSLLLNAQLISFLHNVSYSGDSSKMDLTEHEGSDALRIIQLDHHNGEDTAEHNSLPWNALENSVCLIFVSAAKINSNCRRQQAAKAIHDGDFEGEGIEAEQYDVLLTNTYFGMLENGAQLDFEILSDF